MPHGLLAHAARSYDVRPMAILMAGPPTVITGPRFAETTLRIPLDAAPSPTWLDALRAQELPGKGHRIDGEALEMHLDWDSRDVLAAARKIAAAIDVANEAMEQAPPDAEARRLERAAAATERTNRLLEEWWADNQLKPPTAEPPQLEPGSAA
jgi:hypothetical protein